LGDLITKSVTMLNREALKKATHILFESPPVPINLTFDPAKMRQVVDNLLSNAVKYSPPGSTVRTFVKHTAANSTCSFSVLDQGPGIPDDERDKLFKDFSRLSSKPTGGEKSTGLGLAICRKIVDAHHGQIIVENLPDGGCEFRVTLPAFR
jgi:signal transduction histidine kinase